MTNTEQNFETEWNQKFNHSLNPVSMTYWDAVDSLVTTGFRDEYGVDERIDDWIDDEHEWLWEWRESLWGRPVAAGNTKPQMLSKGCVDSIVNATKAKYKKEMDTRITHFQASFRRRHCIIKMIREMNEKCCRGTGFYSY